MPSTTETHFEPHASAPNPKAGKGATKLLRPSSSPALDIIDIRQESVELNLKEEIHSMLRPQEGPRRMPTLLLYDEKGLQLFEKITYLEEYYLTNYEIEVLRSAAAQMAQEIASGSILLELGSGNLRKVQILLEAIEDAEKKVDYFALDLSEEELIRTLAQIPPFRHVQCHGLLGTYDDGREWLKRPSIAARRKCVLSLGSSIGNFQRDEAASFLKGFTDVLRSTDFILVGVDSCVDPSKVYHAYNDREGVTHQFVLNGLRHANEVLGSEVFKEEDWRVIGEYVYDASGGRHQAAYSPIREVTVLGETIRAEERIQVEQSLKYSKEGMERLWNAAGLVEQATFMRGKEYGLHLLTKSTMPFSLKPSEYAHTNLATPEDWNAIWREWHTVTRLMLPEEELTEKPIKLRNACIFYLGHIPTFLDIQLTKTTKTPATNPLFNSIFERGIDPDVDNPELCHSHSEIPDEWPSVEDILTYQEQVRTRLLHLYSKGQEKIPRDVGRAIWVSFEHELMHIETLLYMMLQSDKTLPPPHTLKPNFASLAQNAFAERVENQWFTVPEQQVTIGLDDPEDVLDSTGHFGWDNEKPSRQVNIHSFQAKGAPITNEEYAQYLYAMKKAKIPASWAEETQKEANGSNGYVNGVTNGDSNGHANGHSNGAQSPPSSFLEGKTVRTVYGLVPLRHALDWPVFASYDELAGCATWMGGRIPTEEEARSIYSYADYMRKEQAENQLGKTVPAVNGHLSNDGVEETPPSRATRSVNGESPGLFVDLTHANVGFKHWHPTPVTAHGNRLAGQSEMGGVWEWTSSTLTKHASFEPMALYPQYTSDFFDGKHNVVLGGSWATHPRIAGRRSFVNWYQRNYPYAWVGARLVRDL
ncbi:C-type lectin protein [Pseudomassariella vexata]|uniref:C-type lectin protein n=1 Tax=Pseudomassariella vexata TaxID=1141098 RepID=A0A1Y2DV15_9PEZI|nr:C-type lectin protein [Pseudomassariella vexata]ORY63132.1 C-type lectin protein [Pseudomassariella vexata]